MSFSTFIKSLIVWYRKRSWWFQLLVPVLIIIILSNIFYQHSIPDDSVPLRSNLIVFGLIYVNAIFLSILAFLIGRNVIKLIFDRRNNILGSKLRTKLVLAFAGLALVTNIVLFIFAGGLLHNALKQFFSVQIEDMVSGAVDVAKFQYASLRTLSLKATDRAVKKLSDEDLSPENHEILRKKLDQIRTSEGFFSITLYSDSGTQFERVANAISGIDSFEEPPHDTKAVQKSLNGNTQQLFEEKDAQQFIRTYIPSVISNKKFALVATLRIQPELSDAMGRVNDTFREYNQTKMFKAPLRSGYLLTLFLITAVLFFGAIWFGFYLSKQLTNPIQKLALATNRVAKGDYDTLIEEVGDDELGSLVRSFNSMLRDLKTTQDEVQRRGAFIETILSRLGVAVLALNKERAVLQVNESAQRLFDIKHYELGVSSVTSLLNEEILEKITPLLSAIEREDDVGQSPVIRECEVRHTHDGEERKLICTIGALNDKNGSRMGSLVLFDDITEITKAQSMAVWREVARRIAHEIKNPLTPIKLSAQRLLKLVKSSGEISSMIECSETIIQNVDSIKRLANEFSNFARMPTIELTEVSLNAICQEVISLYRSSKGEITYLFIPDESIPRLMLDPEQIKRAIINLFDNSIDVLKTKIAPEIRLKTFMDSKANQVTIEVIDNGPGIPAADKLRIFEPYYTTKKEGTGIGLGIVLSIVADHGGTIRVLDFAPVGARFVISLPVNIAGPTQRRLQS